MNARTARYDNFANTLSSLGSVKDKGAGATFRRRDRLSRPMVETMVDQNQICWREVFKIVKTAFRSGWQIKSDGEVLDAFKQRLERELHVSQKVAEAWGWSRLYGACALALPVTDGRAPDLPLNPAAVSAISTPNTIPAHQITPLTFDSAFGSPSYREILSYQIETLNTAKPMRVVHASRLIVFEPNKLPLESRIDALGASHLPWGPSVLQRIYDELLREGTTRAQANAMMYSASLLVLRLEGLGDRITTDEGKADVRSDLAAIRESLDSLGILGLDKNDEVESITHVLTGAGELIASARDALGAALSMPREIGLNESETGLRGGEMSGPQALFYGDTDAARREIASPAIEQIARYAAKAWRVDLGEVEIEWAPLWVPDEAAEADTALKNAQTDEKYHAMQAIGAQEIRQQRFVDGVRGGLRLDEDDAGGLRKQRQYMAPALEIIAAVEAGTIPRDAGMALLIAGGYDATLLGSAGVSKPEPIAPVGPPAVPDGPDAEPGTPTA